jgi:Uma2 family endonuclease
MTRISVEEYLAREQESPIKHEYVDGIVYCMVGARNVHNLIATNALVALGAQLRGKPCRPFNSDTKIRIRMVTETRFYYPDVSVVCHQNPQSDSFQDEPAVILEVLSRKTRRTDETEKKEAYLTLPSLSVYVLIEQELPQLTVWRRTEQGFVSEVVQGMDDVLLLPEIDTELALSDLYDSVEFSAESES